MNADFRIGASELLSLVRETRERTFALTHDLQDEDLDVPRAEIVNPFRWELGHVAFFYDIFFLRWLDGTDYSLDGAERLYDSFHVEHDDRWTLPMPDRAGTLAYMERVHERVLARIPAAGDPGPRESYAVLLSVLHEDMHGEAFTYMRQSLGRPALTLACTPPACANDGALAGDVEVAGGSFELGAGPESPFVFDNEKWAHEVELEPFAIARAPVTNAEFAAFVEDGGYLREECWSHAGWTWRVKHDARAPVYWGRQGAGWIRKDFDRWVELEPHAAVSNVSWWEAEAWCNWAGRRLPSEAEWERAASTAPGEAKKRRFPWGDAPPAPGQANLDACAQRAVDVAACEAGESGWGCRQMLGNVWEWTASDFYPYPGFVVGEPYRQYSAAWFGYRKVLKGGSWATRARLVNNTHRNFFQPYRRDVFAGFRTCAR